MNDDLTAAFKTVTGRGDPWFRPAPECAACEGTGLIQAYAFRSFTQRTCWDCGGDGKAKTDPTIDKDISHDE